MVLLTTHCVVCREISGPTANHTMIRQLFGGKR